MPTKDIPTTFGARLRQARRKAGYHSAEEVGASFEEGPGAKTLEKATIYHWETGHSIPNVQQLAHLCQLYAVSSDYLLFGRVATAHESLRLDPMSLELVARLDAARLDRLKATMVNRVKELSDDQFQDEQRVAPSKKEPPPLGQTRTA